MQKILNFVLFHKVPLGYFVVLFLTSCFFLIQAAPEVLGRLGYELMEIANWDTGMYYAIGKGLAHGIQPYAGLYENKPPMIFLMSAISYKITGGFYLINILSFLSFLTIAILPTIFSLYKGITNKQSPIAVAGISCSVLYISLFLATFAELRSGEVQIEIFGSAALFLSFFAMRLQKGNSKIYSPHIIFSGIFLGVATMFKEPFFLLGVASLLFSVHHPKDFFYHLVLPIVYASLFSLLLLFVTNSFIPYFTVYLANMFGSHLSIYGSPWERASHIFRIFDDMGHYSRALEVCMYALIMANVLIYTKKWIASYSTYDKVLSFGQIFWIFIVLYVASFAVGLGGQYYNHHHIFALPFYGLLIFNIISYCSSPLSNGSQIQLNFITTIILAGFLGVSFSNLAEFKVNENVIRDIQKTKENAAYLDEVLDALGESRYQFVGFNGYHPYAYTKHDAMGPSFVQDSHNFSNDSTFFSKRLGPQFDSVNVVVFDYFNMGAMTPRVISTLNNCFTKQMPRAIQKIKKPDSFRYDMHFRIKKGCSYL